MNRRPDLIVPVRDRRQHKRYLTLKNFAIACGVAIAAFVCVSIYSEVRRPAPNDYGRLARREAPQTPPVAKRVEVIQEATPIDDQASADPTLVSAMTREQWLRDASTTDAGIQPVPPPVSTIRRGDHTVVVGDASGVAIAQQKRRRPVLTGGFGRP